MIQEIFRMLSQSAVEIPTLPVNQCLSHFMQLLKECWAVLQECRVVEKGRQAFGTHMVYRETFLQIQLRLLQHLVRRKWIHGVPEEKSRFIHPQWKSVRNKHQIKIRDASLDRQPKVLSSPVEETLQRIMGQTNNDCRFLISILTSSLHQPRLLAGRLGSRPRCVLVHKTLRKRCIGSKKWRWLIQWMILNLHYLRGI